MKKVLFIVCGMLAFASCSDFDTEGNYVKVVKENAENIFGLIDPNQDWSSVNTLSVNVTANASLKEIAKVQILTESPFFNDEAKVLAEADATKGETVSLSFDAPKSSNRLIAACVDSKGNYYIKGFDVGEKDINFRTSASARTRSVTRAVSDLPDFSTVKIEYSNSFESFNAKRTMLANDAAKPQGLLVKQWIDGLNKNDNLCLNDWAGSNWELDRMWLPTNKDNTNSSWKVVWNTLQASADPLSDDEKAELQDIFTKTLFRTDANDSWNRRDNLSYFREGKAVRFFGNHLVTDGKSPITLMPVQLASKEIYVCHLFYYYYRPADVPAGMSETEYIKQLPKFKAIDLYRERDEWRATTGAPNDKDDETFMRKHQYLLPFYGAPSAFMPTKVKASSMGQTDGKLYRIRNHQKSENKDWYMTYSSTHNQKMKTKYADDAAYVENQLWQIFTTPDNHIMLYNVGAGKFLDWKSDYDTRFVDYFSEPKFLQFKYDDQKRFVFDNVSWKNLKFKYTTDYTQTRNISGDGRKDGNTNEDYWYWDFEEYTGSKNIQTVTDVDLYKYPSTYPAPSAQFEQGYRIGFLLRKQKDNSENNNTHLTNTQDGELYGNGALNTIINRFGQFYSSTSRYTMAQDDPRVGMFNANGKTYLCFEDGSDAQFSDAIIELGGISSSQVKKESAAEPDVQNVEAVIEDEDGEGGSGVYMFDDMEELPNMPFTMCFEDRPHEADYDLNDVVLRCVRQSPTQLQLSVVAAGAHDEVVIQGIPGKCVGMFDLNGKEVHEVFSMGSAQGDDRFINTVAGKVDFSPISTSYQVDASMTIPQFLSQIYIVNATIGNEIHVSAKAEPPYAIIVPGDFNYPRETKRITNVYEIFGNWAKDASRYSNWADIYDIDNVIINPSAAK